MWDPLHLVAMAHSERTRTTSGMRVGRAAGDLATVVDMDGDAAGDGAADSDVGVAVLAGDGASVLAGDRGGAGLRGGVHGGGRRYIRTLTGGSATIGRDTTTRVRMALTWATTILRPTTGTTITTTTRTTILTQIRLPRRTRIIEATIVIRIR